MTKSVAPAPVTTAPGDDTSTTAIARANQQLAHLVEKTADLSRVLGRADLVGRLEQTRSRLDDPYVRVIVVGQYKQGKSKLVNALVNAPACPVDDDIATSVPTSVSYGEEAAAFAIVRNGDTQGGAVDRMPIPLDALADFVSERGRRDEELDIVGAEVVLPRELLRGGLRLVDSPGVGGIESTRSVSTLAALSTAHAVLLVSDASQEYTEPEVQFLKHALRVSPNVAAVLSKTDIYPSWRQIEEIDRSHLGDVGGIPMFAVSSDLRMLAAQEQDRDLNEESGFPALVSHLRRDVLGKAEIVHRRSAVHDLVSVVDQLGMAIKTELNALLNPQDTPAMIAELEAAKARADEFRGRTSRWQVTLSDGIADLISDTEHDLRDRLRKVQREAEIAVDEGDPGPIWDQIAEWLEQRVSNAVSETFVWTNERSRWLSEQVAEEFALEESTIPFIDVGDTAGVLDPVESLQGMGEGRLGAAEKIYIGVRGSYGGVLMAGLATSLVGMALINPLSLLVGVLVGRRAYREDMSARLSRRQAEAKNLARRHIEDVVFQVGKQLKDRLRFVQRVARDHFGGIADELHRSLSESVLAAKQAAATFEADRNGRVIELRQQIARIEALRAEIPASAGERDVRS
ncbi:dynamin family protein [Microbacterium terricola]|uniref:Isoniazid-inducible protein iniA n=1 Tax=Microbacterium terricola TaxID=344163 RepID=A0ABM8E2J1_9MICO|nr:dynamin family protein [Microbacterium terricola]UYK40355.1 dynamin family protein [Microbacterium terricola]BDV31931.1 isoniazid-inducible protein iniA [Microbacterium terricola]